MTTRQRPQFAERYWPSVIIPRAGVVNLVCKEEAFSMVIMQAERRAVRSLISSQ